MRTRKHSARLLVVLVAAATVLLTGCTPQRDLPEQPALGDLQTIDLCALAPPDQVKDEVSDALGRGWMRMTLGACWFQAPATSIWMELAPDRDLLPDSVTEDDPEVSVTEVEGGLIMDTSGPHSPCTQRTLVSDRGYVIEVNAGTTPRDGLCPVLDSLGVLVLGNLATEVPTIEWPEGTVGHVDLCAAVAESDLPEELGVDSDIEAGSANHFDCQIGGYNSLKVSFDSRVTAVKGESRTRTEIGGQPTLSSDEGCSLAIDLGENPELARRIDDGRDALDVELNPQDADCDALPDALDSLVRLLAH